MRFWELFLISSEGMKLPDELRGRFPSVILFDGVCNMCNGLVLFMIRWDVSRKFHFAALQSKAGRQICDAIGRSHLEVNTVIYIRREEYFQKSRAILEIFRDLPFPWPLLYGLMAIPRIIRDAVYDVVSKNRYRWFGKREACLRPTAEVKSLFME